MAEQFDVVVIGAGPGGYVAAIRASQLGLKTAIIEREYWGGVCLNIGCIPSKALLHNAELAHTMAHRAEEFGFSFDNFRADWKKAWERSRDVSGNMVKGVKFLMKKNKITVFEGAGTITSPTSVQVSLNKGGEETVNGNSLIIATGARPRVLPGLEPDGKKIISYIEGIMADTNPDKVVIVGGGVIGVEFTYMWANYGSDVTIVEMQDRLVPLEDPKASKLLMRSYKKMGVTLEMGTVVDNVEHVGDKMTVTLKNGNVITDVDQIMVAVSFQPNIENIGLEAIGVKQAERGNHIEVDQNMRTNIPNVYAIGDVTGQLLLAHVASAMGMVAAEAIAGHHTEPLNMKMMPRATYCQPQIASFGYTEAEAKELGYDINIGEFPFQANGKARGLGDSDGFVKIISDAKYGELLGAHMVGHGVTELLPELTLAWQNELTAEEIAHNIHAHPTMSEVVMEAAHGVEGQPLHI